MTLREFMETKRWEVSPELSLSVCNRGVDFARRYNFDVRKMLTNKAQETYGDNWDGPPIWCLLWALINVGPARLALGEKRHEALYYQEKWLVRRPYSVAEQREQYRVVSGLLKQRGITHRKHRASSVSDQPRLF